VTFGYAALACLLCLPLTLALAIVTGYVIQGIMALVAFAEFLAFCAAPVLAGIAWRMGSRELAVQTSAAPAERPRQALQARSLGRSTLLLWGLLVLLAALTYTKKIQ
jgi:hypothetical protein